MESGLEFDEALEKICALLEAEGRVSYRGLARRLALDPALLEDLCEEIIYAKRLASDEGGRVLVWNASSPVSRPHAESVPRSPAIDGDDAPWRPHEGERRQLTVMFCDLVDSTPLSTRLDPEDLREVLHEYHVVATRAIEAAGGHVAQYLGDGLLVYFGFPRAHEDDAQRAVRAGIAILEAMRALDRRVHSTHGVHIAARIGVHTGEVVVGAVGHGHTRENLALGEVPNIAARIQGLAEPGHMLLSQATMRLVREAFELERLGPHNLKGVSVPIAIARVIGERAPELERSGRTSAPLVGRNRELEQLVRRLEESIEGTGRAVLVRGEAGIGKSVLVERLRDEAARRGLTRISIQCAAHYAHSALHPIVEHLHRLLGDPRRTRDAERLAKLDALLDGFEPSLTPSLPLFAALIGLPLPAAGDAQRSLSPELRRERTHAALIEWVFAEAARLPVLLVWEDVHWADPSTLELVERFLEQSQAHPILIAMTSRNEFKPPWPQRPHVETLTLGRLASSEIQELVREKAGGKKLPPEVVRQVVDRTDGIPLFAEELLQMLLESDLIRSGANEYTLVGHLPGYGVPVTLRDSLMARLDRLGPARELAQLAAVIGREFSYELLSSVREGDALELRRDLMRLVDAELLVQRGVLPTATFAFKHALIQDAAYESLLRRTRQLHHARIFECLRERFPEREASEPELLAHHAAEAGRAREAIGYLQRAARNAVHGSAHIEAVAHLQRAIELSRTLPEDEERTLLELALQTAYGPALMAQRGYASREVEGAYARARELCAGIPDSPRRGQVLAGLATYYFTRGELRTARELGLEYLPLAEQSGDVPRILQARLALGSTLYFMGRLREAAHHLGRGLELAERSGDDSPARGAVGDPRVLLRTYLGLVLEGLGESDESRRLTDAAIALAERYQHPISLAPALDGAALGHLIRREHVQALERARTGMRVSEAHAFPTWYALGQVVHGAARSASGDAHRGADELARGIEGWQAAGAQAFVPSALCLLAQARLTGGDVEGALDAAERGLRGAQANDDRCFEAELFRLRAQARSARAAGVAATEVRADLVRAIEVARQQEARNFELRATLELARFERTRAQAAASAGADAGAVASADARLHVAAGGVSNTGAEGGAHEALAQLRRLRKAYRDEPASQDLRDVDAFLSGAQEDACD